MQVTFCAYDRPDNYCGPNAWLKRILPELRERGVESRVLFITHGDQGPTIRELQQKGFECPQVNWPRFTEDRVRWILEQVQSMPPNVFVPNLLVPAYYAGKWIREAGIPTVGILHSDDAFHWGLVSEFVCGSPDYRLSKIVCVSRFLEGEVRKLETGGTTVSRIPYIVPVPENSASLPRAELRMAYVGRFVEQQKRISDLTRSMCRAVKEVPGTEAILYGDGAARPNVEKIIRDEGSPSVCLAGRIGSDRIQRELLHCHVFVLLSDYEGLPIALMEAMSCGVVPICLRTQSGIEELVEDHVSGLIVNSRGDEFVEAVRRLKTEPGLWKNLSRGARIRMERTYSVSVIADAWMQLFASCVESTCGTGAIRIPTVFNLPPVHPGLAREDYRQEPLWLYTAKRGMRRVRKVSSVIMSRLVRGD